MPEKTEIFSMLAHYGFMNIQHVKKEEGIDELSEEHWKVWDVSGDKVSSAPSKWTVVDHEVHQTSNILDGGASDTKSTTRRDGTLRMLRATTDLCIWTIRVRW